MSDQKYLLGLDLGGTSVKGVAVTPEGQPLGTYHLAYDRALPLAFATTAAEVAAQARAEHGPAERIGLSAPGLVAPAGDRIAHMPGRFPGLEGFDWGGHLKRTEGVRVLNDAQAALLGEVWIGGARGASDVVLLTLGTGVGGAVMLNGHLLRGHTGKAGHLGHSSLDPAGTPDICGTPGSLEDAIGNHNISARSGGRFTTTRELLEAQAQGDVFAAEVWQKSLLALAAAIVSFGNILDPEIVILGGGIAAAGDVLLPPLRRLLDQMEWRPTGRGLRLVPAELGDLAGAYGAAWNTYR